MSPVENCLDFMAQALRFITDPAFALPRLEAYRDQLDLKYRHACEHDGAPLNALRRCYSAVDALLLGAWLPDKERRNIESEIVDTYHEALEALRAAAVPVQANKAKKNSSMLTAAERAMQILMRDPNQSDRQVAEQAGCHGSVLSRSPKYQRLREALNQGLPKGAKGKDGSLEAEDADDR